MYELDRLIEDEQENGAEIAVHLSIETETMWAGELRYTPQPNKPNGPDRSFVFYAVGGNTAEEIIRRLLRDFQEWKR
jgi:hypothetical protein